MALQPVKLNDCVEAEISRLNHLRDQASQKGNIKENYVRKLQLLRSPQERQRRVSEAPEIHVELETSPNYEAEDTRHSNNIKKGGHEEPKPLKFPQNGKISPDNEDEHEEPRPLKFPQNGTTSPDKEGVEEGSIQAQDRMREKTDAKGSPSVEKCKNQVNISDSPVGGGSSPAIVKSELETSKATVSMGNSLTDNNIETEKLWHYRDPNGKIQGPFSMMHLRQWSTTGLFPKDMRIWTNHELFDSLLLLDALNGKYHGVSELPHKPKSKEHRASGGGKVIDMNDGDRKPTEPLSCTKANVLSDNNSGSLKANESSWPHCWDFLKDDNSRRVDDVATHSLHPSSSPGQAQGSVELNRVPETTEENSSEPAEKETATERKLEIKSTSEGQAVQLGEENLRSLPIDLSLNDIKSKSVLAPVSKPPPESIKQDGALDVSDLLSPSLKTRIDQWGAQTVSRPLDSIKQDGAVDVSDLLSPTLKTRTDPWGVQTVSRASDSFKQDGTLDVSDLFGPTLKTTDQWGVQIAASNVPTQTSGILELLSLTPRSNNEDPARQTTETRQSGLVNLPEPNSGPSWNGVSNLMGVRLQLPEVADDWCKFPPTPAKPSVHEWDPGLIGASSSKPPELMTDNVANSDGNQLHLSPSHPTPNITNWLAMLNEPIEFDALGEESVSDLLAEVDAMESQGGLPSPMSAMKFAKELIQDCKDDCFSSIDEFDPGKSDALSSTGEIQLSGKPAGPSPIDGLDSFSRSGVHSCGSSAGETNAPVYQTEAGSDFHPHVAHSQDMVNAAAAPGMGSEATEPNWGNVQGNINLVTVQGNVNLVLNGPGQGMANLGWGANPGTGWGNPNLNHSPINASLPWDGGQRKYGGDRFPSPREWGYQGGDPGFGRGRPPWGGRPYNARKGPRLCKFYESGRCKKGAFCDYLHPS